MQDIEQRRSAMRARVLLLVIAILVVAAFAAMNWSEVLRATPLSFGLFVMEAPLGLILLGLLMLTLLGFLAQGAMHRTQTLIESRQHLKDLEHQRALADRAEASRFTELRQHLDTSLRELRQRDTIAATEFEKAMVQGQRELRTQLEQMHRTLAARLTEMEHLVDGRGRPVLARDPVVAHPVAAEPVHPAEPLRAAEPVVPGEPPKRRFWNL
jgi:hypothetical protein